MSNRGSVVGVLTLVLLATSSVGTQESNARERAREPYSAGIEHMRAESFDAAARAFQTAIEIDPAFEMAHYMLGRVHLVQRNYVSAVYALAKSRDLYIAQGSRQFENTQEGQRVRRERLAELDDLIRRLQLVPQTPPVVEQIRQLRERKRQIEDLDRERTLTREQLVPAFVSLSLGSAYLRAGKLPEAEKAYLETVAADPRTGEAHNNLAVVYLQTGRLDEAEKSVTAAERTGFRVHPELKQEIARRRKARVGQSTP